MSFKPKHTLTFGMRSVYKRARSRISLQRWCGDSAQIAGFVKAFEQQMEENQAAITFPLLQNVLHSLVIEFLSKAQPAFQVISGADVVTGKYIGPPQTAKQHVFRCPSSYSAQCDQAFNTLSIFQMGKIFQIELPGDN